MASAPSISPRPQNPPDLPQRPPRRPAPRRAATVLFWTVFLLFIAAIGYLGLLAFTGNTEKLVSGAASAVDSHPMEISILALAAVAAVAGGIATHHHMR